MAVYFKVIWNETGKPAMYHLVWQAYVHTFWKINEYVIPVEVIAPFKWKSGSDDDDDNNTG